MMTPVVTQRHRPHLKISRWMTQKAVSIDCAHFAAAVKDGSYAIARPFNIVTKGETGRAGRRLVPGPSRRTKGTMMTSPKKP